MLSITGVLINHSQGMSLAEKRLPAWLAKPFYGLDEVSSQSLSIGEITAEAAAGELVISASALSQTTPCTGSFVGARRFADEVWFACENQISVFLLEDSSPQFVELINAFSGLPIPAERFGACELNPCLISGGDYFRYSLSQYNWQQLETSPGPSFWSDIPDSETRLLVSAEHNWERWLLDLHSGRLFGWVGILIVDLTAIAILFLVLSGFLRWIRTSKPRS